jgi:hypothetical protein
MAVITSHQPVPLAGGKVLELGLKPNPAGQERIQ